MDAPGIVRIFPGARWKGRRKRGKKRREKRSRTLERLLLDRLISLVNLNRGFLRTRSWESLGKTRALGRREGLSNRAVASFTVKSSLSSSSLCARHGNDRETRARKNTRNTLNVLPVIGAGFPGPERFVPPFRRRAYELEETNWLDRSPAR